MPDLVGSTRPGIIMKPNPADSPDGNEGPGDGGGQRCRSRAKRGENASCRTQCATRFDHHHPASAGPDLHHDPQPPEGPLTGAQAVTQDTVGGDPPQPAPDGFDRHPKHAQVVTRGAVSSVGQSACLTSRMSGVRAPHGPHSAGNDKCHIDSNLSRCRHPLALLQGQSVNVTGGRCRRRMMGSEIPP